MIAMTFGYLLGAVILFIVFGAVPFVWKQIFHREEKFMHFVGFYRPQICSSVWLLLAFAAFYLVFYQLDPTTFFDAASLEEIQASSTASVYSGLGFSGVLPAMVSCYLQNGLSEEMLFRGFLGKRFMARFGRLAGNILQAVCFGMMHVLLFWAADTQVEIGAYVVLFLFTGFGGWLLGFLNENIFNGSIIPSILLHGTGNFVSTALLLFS